jgi:hypothetical protein
MILVRDLNAAPIGAGILQKAFEDAGMTAAGASTPEVEMGKFVLWIGPKPRRAWAPLELE